MFGATRSRIIGALTLGLTGVMSLTGCAQRSVRLPTPAEDDVDIAYGSRPRRLVTSAIASVDHTQIARQGGPSVIDLLLRVPGVSVTGAAGQVAIRIRSASRDPLVVIDGIPRSSGVSALLALTPADIERIDVLKDGTAAGTYGLRGGSGVILVQTGRRR